MRIINVIEIVGGVLSSIESFPISGFGYTADAIEKVAEELFIRLAKENGYEGDVDHLFNMGNWDDENGYEVILTWSNVNE